MIIQADFKRRLKKQNYRHLVILELYRRQTDDERSAKKTIDHNDVGFTSFDAPVLTPIAEKVERRERLSKEEERQLRYRLPKYWGQFTVTTLVEPPTGRRAA